MFVYLSLPCTCDSLECSGQCRKKERAAVGKVYFFEPDHDEQYGKVYRSAMLCNPTWEQVRIAAEDMCRTVHDFHHVFLEGIREHEIQDVSGATVYRFLMGS